jgi:hypothetical protein
MTNSYKTEASKQQYGYCTSLAPGTTCISIQLCQIVLLTTEAGNEEPARTVSWLDRILSNVL